MEPHHGDLLHSRDNCIHKRFEFGVVVQVVSMADAHEEDVSWQNGDHVDRHTFGFKIYGQIVTHL